MHSKIIFTKKVNELTTNLLHFCVHDENFIIIIICCSFLFWRYHIKRKRKRDSTNIKIHHHFRILTNQMRKMAIKPK